MLEAWRYNCSLGPTLGQDRGSVTKEQVSENGWYVPTKKLTDDDNVNQLSINYQTHD